MMKSLFGGCFILLLLLDVAHNVESRRHDDDDAGGAMTMTTRRTRSSCSVTRPDNGNFPNAGLNQGSPSWYYPYGISDKDNDNLPSGRFSDNMVQSDFLGTQDSWIRSSTSTVTDEMVRIVNQLQDLGVSKVLVNTVPPLGCTPWTTSRFSSYDYCDQRTNSISDVHNKYLTDKLGNKDGVLLLDVNTIVTSLLQSSQFQDHKSRPCCETKDQDGYCGQYAGQTPQFTVCRDPGQYLYWDFLHPTHAGWKAIMQRLQSAIRDFLDI
ncbi:hypothetical protein PR202_ga18905 [Eleusine coracana subsp. coracana]|uniref:GDSL esterase/lipase n=1 Tax=Eleusine coracana subsp. coracana TaxID=191504 RepID=A0AAV5CU74_ELECO|nr:hypothetical protein PR202_ga18905 [Eleusine coracana subsp. coracana]